MTKTLLTRSKFAQLAGVTPSTVTGLCAKRLLPACVGKYIDLDHDLVKTYLHEKTAPRPEGLPNGIDPLFQQVADWCAGPGKWSQRAVQREFHIGRDRVTALFQVLRAAGLVPDAPIKPVETPRVVVKAAAPLPQYRRGHQAAADKRKADAWEQADPGPLDDGLLDIPQDIQMFADMTLRELVERFGTDVRFADWLNATQKIETINEKRLKNAETEGRLVSRALVKSAVVDPIDAVFVRMLTDGASTIASRCQAMAKAGSDLTELRAMVEDQLGAFIRPAKAKIAGALRDA